MNNVILKCLSAVIICQFFCASNAFAGECISDNWQPTFIRHDSAATAYYSMPNGNFIPVRNKQEKLELCETQGVRDSIGGHDCKIRKPSDFQCGCNNERSQNSTCQAFQSFLESQTETQPTQTPENNFQTDLSKLADSCYDVPKDQIRVIASLTSLNSEFVRSENVDSTVRPFSTLNRGRHAKYEVEQLTPMHAFHLAQEGVITGIPNKFTLNLHTGSSPDPISGTFEKLGYIDINPSALPIIFDLQIADERGKDTLPQIADMTNKIVSYSGGQCVVKSFFLSGKKRTVPKIDEGGEETVTSQADLLLRDWKEDVLIGLFTTELGEFLDRLLTFKYRGGKENLKNPIKIFTAVKDLLTDDKFAKNFIRRLKETDFLEKRRHEIGPEFRHELAKLIMLEYVRQEYGEEAAFYVDMVGFNLASIAKDAKFGNVGGLAVTNAEIWYYNVSTVTTTIFEMEAENAANMSVSDLKQKTQNQIDNLLANATPQMTALEKTIIMQQYKAHSDHLVALQILENHPGYSTLHAISKLGVLHKITDFYDNTLSLRVEGKCDISVETMQQQWQSIKTANSTPAILLPIVGPDTDKDVKPTYCSL